ncbi:MAG: hypothetical protein DRQ65_00080 [Gammaproteobacteria bacterium]|nr:MAG: hypothetical protein DRQ97_04350 [Gammaproteobacteria bacterium]RLA58018.1 MAG: hypothetical protein DRQ65_00080 [Gammaproteobacteria bacterium]
MRTFLTGLEGGVLKVVSQVLWPLLLVLITTFARADIVRDLYAAQVPVADQSSRALARASREALAEVLVKVSGSVEVLQYPAVAAALGKARSHVQQYAYSRDESVPPKLSVRLEFDGSFVTRLVTEAGAPLWTANRPPVLVWVVVEDASGRYFVNWDTAPDLTRQLLAEFARRGVPVQLPLFDLADSAAISPEEVWRLHGPALQAASARYDVQNILSGRLAALSVGNSVGDWSYFYSGDRIDRSVTAPDAGAFLREGVSIVAEEMSARYAVVASGTDESSVSMSVVGVFSYADYAGIVAWLEGLELIEHANIERIQGDRIELRLYAQADADQLAAIIELNERLVSLPPTAANSQLSYQWQ